MTTNLNRRLTRPEVDAMLDLLRHDKSAAAAINILQDVLRYKIHPTARTEIPFMIRALREQYPDLGRPIDAPRRRIVEEMINIVLSAPVGGKTRRRRRTRKNRK
jgi:hypothetical protein